jgi:hypothetical protein
MSITSVTEGSQRVVRPRVRHQARDAVALMAFSALTSVTIAGVLVLLAHWGR